MFFFSGVTQKTDAKDERRGEESCWQPFAVCKGKTRHETSLNNTVYNKNFVSAIYLEFSAVLKSGCSN